MSFGSGPEAGAGADSPDPRDLPGGRWTRTPAWRPACGPRSAGSPASTTRA